VGASAVRAVLDRTSLDEYDFTMLSAYGPASFVREAAEGAVTATVLFYGVVTRNMDRASAPSAPAAAEAAEPAQAAPSAAAAVVAAAPPPAAAAVADEGEEDDDDDDDDEEEEEEEAAAAAGATLAGPAAPAPVPAVPSASDGPNAPDSYDDQWFTLERAAALLSDDEQQAVLAQAVRVFRLSARTERTPLSDPDVQWPAATTTTATAIPPVAAAAADTRLPVTVLSGFLGGMSRLLRTHTPQSVP
jgi:hypothetical protein